MLKPGFWLPMALLALMSIALIASASTADAAAPVNISITPSGGTLGLGSLTYTSVYRDADGYANIRLCYLLINDTWVQSNAVLAFYDRLTNKLYLKNDANTSWGTGYAPGTAVTLQNSQCILDVGATSVSTVGTDVTVRWRIQLKSPFEAKQLNAYMFVKDSGGLTDGWDTLGIYYNVKPLCLSIAPDTAALPVGIPTTMTSVYRDSNGSGDLRRCYVLLCTSFNQTDAIYLVYDKLQNKVFLRDDFNVTWGTGYAPGAAATLTNTQCSVDVSGISVVESGTDMQITWAFTVTVDMATNLYSWMYASDSKGAVDGWKKMGIHFTPVAPVCSFLSPTSGPVNTGVELTFTSRYWDDNGQRDLSKVYFQLSPTSSQANAILLMFDLLQNKLYLRNDAHTSWGVGQAPGASTVLQNSQCSINMASVPEPFQLSDSEVEIIWPITLKPSQAGKKLQERMFAVDQEKLSSGWKYKGYVTAQ